MKKLLQNFTISLASIFIFSNCSGVTLIRVASELVSTQLKSEPNEIVPNGTKNILVSNDIKELGL